MVNLLRPRCALALLLLSLTPACRKQQEKPAEPPVPSGVPAAVDPLPAQPEAPAQPELPASREDALACEALLDLRTLMAGQGAFFAEKDEYAADFSLFPALPACADGTRAPAPDATWRSGCHFRYRVSATSPLPEATFTVQAVGTGAAEGREYTLRSGLEDSDRSWPTALTPDVCGARLAPSVCEAALNLRGLFIAQKAYFAEKDRYSADLAAVGFRPEPCLDGTRADGQPPPGAGCHFHYEAEVQGTAPAQTFTATARGTGPLEGTVLHHRSDSTWGPEGVDVRACFETGAPAACEAAENLRSLLTAERAHYGEKDRYSEDLAVVGFEAPPCIDGARAGGGQPPATGCRYTYRVEVHGEAPQQDLTLIAQGMDALAGTELRLHFAFGSDLSWTPAEPACGR